VVLQQPLSFPLVSMDAEWLCINLKDDDHLRCLFVFRIWSLSRKFLRKVDNSRAWAVIIVLHWHNVVFTSSGEEFVTEGNISRLWVPLVFTHSSVFLHCQGN
jgi:hypothetical protein